MIVVINADTLAASEWSVDGVIDLAVAADGALQVLTADGVAVLDDAATKPAAYVETGAMALVPSGRCNIPRVGIMAASDADLRVQLTAGVGGETSARTYVLPKAPGAGRVRDRTMKTARGPRAEEWTVRISGTGGAVELASAEVVVDRVKTRG